MSPDDPIVRVLAEAPCQGVEAPLFTFQECTGTKRKHPECAAAALRRYFASEEVQRQAQALVNEATWDLAKQTFLVPSLLAALSLTEQP